MQQTNKIFELETRSGEPVTVGDTRLTPQSQALTIRWPGGGFVWNRPVAVIAEQAGQIERIPIVDVTLVTQAVLVALSAAFALTRLILSASQRRK